MPEIPPTPPHAPNSPRWGNHVADAESNQYRQRLGSLLRRHRRSIEPPISQKDVADYLGMAQSAVSDWERGESWPTVFCLLGLLRYLRIDPAELLLLLESNGDDTERAA